MEVNMLPKHLQQDVGTSQYSICTHCYMSESLFAQGCRVQSSSNIERKSLTESTEIDRFSSSPV